MTSQPEQEPADPTERPTPPASTSDPAAHVADDAPVADPDSDPPDDCSEMVARLYYFLDGELTDERRTRIQAHLDRCPSCFGAFDFEAELRIVVASRVRSHVPQHLADRIRLSLGAAGFPGGDAAPGAGGTAGPFA